MNMERRYYKFRFNAMDSPWLVGQLFVRPRGGAVWLFLLPLVPKDMWTRMGHGRLKHEYEQIPEELVPEEVKKMADERGVEAQDFPL